jgi:hypothetical protein
MHSGYCALIDPEFRSSYNGSIMRFIEICGYLFYLLNLLSIIAITPLLIVISIVYFTVKLTKKVKVPIFSWIKLLLLIVTLIGLFYPLSHGTYLYYTIKILGAGPAAKKNWLYFSSDIKIVRALVDSGVNVNTIDYRDGRTLLMYKSYTGELEIVKLLIEKGC